MMMMMVEKEDLGLNLGLSLSSSQAKTAATVSDHHVSDDSNFSSPPFMAPFSNFVRRSAHWSQTPLFSDGRVSFAKMGIDVNCAPEEMEADDGGAWSPNSTVCSSSGKRSGGDEECLRQVDGDRACSRGSSDEDEDGADHNARRNNSNKKLRLSKDQAAVLEETFRGHNTLNPKQKLVLAKRLGLRPRQVEVWFQNRRARTKLKQTEVDCEYLRRCCDALREENRRLQKELHQLKALKLSHHRLHTHMPPTTLTMCPSCNRTGTARPVAAARPWSVPPHPLQSSGH